MNDLEFCVTSEGCLFADLGGAYYYDDFYSYGNDNAVGDDGSLDDDDFPKWPSSSPTAGNAATDEPTAAPTTSPTPTVMPSEAPSPIPTKGVPNSPTQVPVAPVAAPTQMPAAGPVSPTPSPTIRLTTHSPTRAPIGQGGMHTGTLVTTQATIEMKVSMSEAKERDIRVQSVQMRTVEGHNRVHDSRSGDGKSPRDMHMQGVSPKVMKKKLDDALLTEADVEFVGFAVRRVLVLDDIDVWDVKAVPTALQTRSLRKLSELDNFDDLFGHRQPRRQLSDELYTLSVSVQVTCIIEQDVPSKQTRISSSSARLADMHIGAERQLDGSDADADAEALKQEIDVSLLVADRTGDLQRYLSVALSKVNKGDNHDPEIPTSQISTAEVREVEPSAVLDLETVTDTEEPADHGYSEVFGDDGDDGDDDVTNVNSDATASRDSSLNEGEVVAVVVAVLFVVALAACMGYRELSKGRRGSMLMNDGSEHNAWLDTRSTHSESNGSNMDTQPVPGNGHGNGHGRIGTNGNGSRSPKKQKLSAIAMNKFTSGRKGKNSPRQADGGGYSFLNKDGMITAETDEDGMGEIVLSPFATIPSMPMTNVSVNMNGSPNRNGASL
jgi:hypothetical protein